jgi:hypothetical protein
LLTCFLADREKDQNKRAPAFTLLGRNQSTDRWRILFGFWRFLFGVFIWRCVAVCVGFNSAKPPCHSERHSIQLPKSKIQSSKSKMVNIGRKSFRQREMLARIENHE